MENLYNALPSELKPFINSGQVIMCRMFEPYTPLVGAGGKGSFSIIRGCYFSFGMKTSIYRTLQDTLPVVASITLEKRYSKFQCMVSKSALIVACSKCVISSSASPPRLGNLYNIDTI